MESGHININKHKAVWFDVECDPPTATSQQKGAMRCGKGIRFYTKPHVAQAKADLTKLLWNHGPGEPLDGALCLRLTYRFPMRKSETKARRALGFLHHDKRPDLDNLAKLTIDVMAGLKWFNDDAQISRLELSKCWSITPGIRGEINVI
tara:strand:- start:29 stop:475 length:447 start_codon:yes stop_codon:yes gene_type:complete